MRNRSYIVNEKTNQSINLSQAEAEFLSKQSLEIIAERLAKEQLIRENKSISNINLTWTKNKILRKMLKDLKQTQKIKKLEKQGLFSVEIHSQDFEWTSKDMKQLYLALHREFEKISTSKFVFNKEKKLNFYAKFINKIMILYPQWEVERLMKLDNYVNNPINGFDNRVNSKSYWEIVNNKIKQIQARDINKELEPKPILKEYWAKKITLSGNNHDHQVPVRAPIKPAPDAPRMVHRELTEKDIEEHKRRQIERWQEEGYLVVNGMPIRPDGPKPEKVWEHYEEVARRHRREDEEAAKRVRNQSKPKPKTKSKAKSDKKEKYDKWSQRGI